jgi:hypothetical protein
MAIFGAMAALMGVVGILWPEGLLALMSVEVIPSRARVSADLTLSFVTASSVAALNMGAYYLLAARAGWRAFYRWTVPFRGLTFLVFTSAVVLGRAPLAFVAVALWELLGAIITGLALRREDREARDRER